MVGDGEPFVAALLVLDPDVAPAWAASHGASGTTLAELAVDPVVHAEVEREVAVANERFSHAEADPRVHGAGDGVAPRHRGAHAHHEAEASRDRGEVRGEIAALYGR